MPTNITIRDIPDDVYEKLKKQAELHHRSINSGVIYYLKRIVQSHRPDPDQIIARALTRFSHQEIFSVCKASRKWRLKSY